MSFRDAMVTCEKCGKQFIFTVEEQRRLARRGEEVVAPALCPACRGGGAIAAEPAPRVSAGETDLGPHEGVVKWYNPEKGYGFILHQNGEEIFFHRSGIIPGGPERIPDGARVSYLVEETSKGLQAVEVALMEEVEE